MGQANLPIQNTSLNFERPVITSNYSPQFISVKKNEGIDNLISVIDETLESLEKRNHLQKTEKNLFVKRFLHFQKHFQCLMMIFR